MKVDPSFKPFEVIEGGKAESPIIKPEGSDGSGDWLRRLPVKTKFLAKWKPSKGPLLENYGILQFTNKAALLYNFLPRMGDITHIWVDTALFSKDNILIEILPENPPEEEGKKKNVRSYLLVEESREEHDGHEGPD